MPHVLTRHTQPAQAAQPARHGLRANTAWCTKPTKPTQPMQPTQQRMRKGHRIMPVLLITVLCASSLALSACFGNNNFDVGGRWLPVELNNNTVELYEAPWGMTEFSENAFREEGTCIVKCARS